MLDAQDDQYKSVCCGYVKSWQYYAMTNTGTGYFQIWRDTSATLSTWTLIGENEVTHTNDIFIPGINILSEMYNPTR
ncbi:hypothetical protein KUTeg_015782 [Tegillarca granosa]|uniref:Uncharacterized protein n=1 Tax=Tegillarca granosa TaxID=220873 RepID=A0ABQ9ENB3_TEGGR|nr:hypothetical protein KUTeg_015782 [Tegillarca granosa]